MPESDAVVRALLAIVSDGSDDRVLAQRICRACIEGLDVDGAVISVLTASVSRETLWASDATAQRLEDLQFSLGEGACMQAARTGVPVLVPDLRDSTEVARWPIFAAAVAEQTTVRALFALPLQWGVINLGVLDLYRTTPGGLSQAQWRDALSAADIAALMMLTLRTDPDNPGNLDGVPGADGTVAAAGWLDHSLGSHTEIHQATGMVLAQLGITAAEALARLRGHAFVEKRLLLDVARDVVDRRLVFTEDMR
jgi:hypothetical protein